MKRKISFNACLESCVRERHHWNAPGNMSSQPSLFTCLVVLTVWDTLVLAQFVYECPLDWPAFEHSCYHFVSYPLRPFDEASQSCRNDGASLVSINTPQEHQFIVSWLARHHGSGQDRWYTSGVDTAGQRKWLGDDQPMSSDAVYWNKLDDAATLQQNTERHLVYEYSESRRTFGWAWTTRTKVMAFICEISQKEIYRVYQKNRDFSYGSELQNPNDWITGPKILFQSKSIVFAGRVDSISIECSASGNPAPHYQWFKNYGSADQELITGQTNSRYTVTNGRLTLDMPSERQDSGEYTCVAENTAGKVFSGPIQVAGGYIGEFSNDKPGTRTALKYQGTVLDCKPPSFNPALVSQWMKANRFLRPEMNPHTFLSENGKLYFSEVQEADAADYHCIVTLVALPGQELATAQPLTRNSLGIRLQVAGESSNTFGPEIHNDFPAVFPQNPLAGQDLRLECLAYGRLPLNYAWSRVDGDLPMDRVTFESLNRIMVIRDLRLEDSGEYTCTVRGSSNVDTRNITVNVEASPYFLFPLRDQHLDVGSQLTWVCDAVAIPTATYTWYKDGQILITNTDTDITVTGKVLTIASADASKHSGMYECLAHNMFGTNTSAAQVRVLAFKPSFGKMPVATTLSASVGGNITIHCWPEAAPPPVITWTHNGASVGGSGHAQQMQNGDLLLTSLSIGDSGTYTCTAENSLGSASSSGHLTVLSTTTLSYVPQPQEVFQNETAHVSCQASYAVNRTDLAYVWYFNDKLLDMDIDPSYKIGDSRGINGLYIVGAQFKHEGWYECRATTVFDSIGGKAYLTVKGPPEEPAGLHVHQTLSRQVELWWQPGRTRGDVVTQYRIEYRSDINPTWRSLETGISASGTVINEYPQWRSYTTGDTLSPGCSYQFRVSAASQNFGYSHPSLPSDYVKLPDAAPIYATDLVTGGGGSAGMLNIRWKPLPPEQHGGSGLYYKVYWRLHDQPTEKWRSSTEKFYGDNVDRDGLIVFHQLVGTELYYTPYDVMVQSINNVGPGPNSSVEVVFSAEDLPQTTPQKVKTSAINATAMVVTWQLPNSTREDLRGKIWGFQLNYWDINEERTTSWYYRTYGEEMRAVVIGLKGNGDYWVDVQVFNTAGLSRPSGRTYMPPNYDPPHAYPDFVTVSSDGPESVRVSWRGVSTTVQESPVKGYKIWWWPSTDNIRTAKELKLRKVFTGVLHGVEKDVIYKLRVMAWGIGGDGAKSVPTYFTLGGQVHLDPLTSEILASCGLTQPCVIILLLCHFAVLLSRTMYS